MSAMSMRSLAPRGQSWTSRLPRLSIIVPSFNQARFLERTIKSIVSQGYDNLELIIVDGGSTDGSVEIVRRYDKEIAYCISEPDRGQAQALNKGLAAATGDVIGWQNSDDVYLPGAFALAIKTLEDDPRVDLVFGNVKVIAEDDTEVGELRFVPFSRWALLSEGTMLANQAAFWRRALHAEVGPFDERLRFSMDYDFFVRASRVGRFKHIRAFLGAFRIHVASKSTQIASVGLREHHEVLERLEPNRLGAKYPQLMRRLSRGRRAALYALQGDLKYLVRPLASRLRSRLGAR